MGLFEDVVRKLAVELLAPAIKATREYFGVQYTAVIAFFGAKLQVFFEWIAYSNISIFSWVRNEIQKAIDKIDTGEWSFSLWIQAIINAVFDAVKHLFVRIGDLISSVQDIIADWWVDTLASVKKVISSMITIALDFVSDNFTKFTDWVKTLGKTVAEFIADSIKKASDLITDTVNNVIEDVSGILNKIADSLLPAISNLQDSITDLAVDIAEDIVETTNDFAKLIGEETVKVMTALDDVKKELEESIPDIAGGIWDAFVAANPVMKFLSDMITGTYMDTAENKRRQQAVIDERTKIREIVEGLD